MKVGVTFFRSTFLLLFFLLINLSLSAQSITDGDMEGLLPGAWLVTGGMTLTADGVNFNGGAQSGSLIAGDITSSYLYQSMGVGSDKVVDVSFYSIRTFGAFGVQVGIHDGTSLVYSNEFVGTAGWVQYNFSFPAASGTTYEIRFAGGSGTTISLDDVVVIVNAVPTANGLTIGDPGGGLLTGNVLQMIESTDWTYGDTDTPPDAQGTHLYQWYRADNSTGLNRAAISGATADTYIMAVADVGKFIDVEVTPVAATGSSPGAVATSPVVGPIVQDLVPTFASASITVPGPGVIIGEILTGAPVTYGDDNVQPNFGTHTFQWYQDTDDGGAYDAGDAAISGATATTYQVTAADAAAAHKLIFGVIPVATTGASPGIEYYAITGPVAAGDNVPTFTTGTAIGGGPPYNIGTTFTATAGTYNDDNTQPNFGTHLYQWYQDVNSTPGGEVVIAGATSTTYDATASDVGYWLGCIITPVALTGTSPGTPAVIVYGGGLIVSDVPGIPTLVSPADGAPNIELTPTLTWARNAGAGGIFPLGTDYDLEVSTNASFGTTVFTSSAAWATSIATSALTTNTKYYWRVRAKAGGFDSPWSSIWTFTTTPVTTPIISYPTGGTTVYSASPTIYWYSLGYAPLATYTLYVDTDIGFGGATTYGSLTTTYQALSGLTPGATYYIKVDMVQGVITETSTIETFIVSNSAGGVVVPILSYPTGGVSVYDMTPTLYWYLGTYSTGLTYDIDLSTSGTFASYVYQATGVTSMYVTAPALVAGTTYYWRVRSDNGSITSAWSATESFSISTYASGVVPVPIPSWPVGGATVYSTSASLYWYVSSTTIGLTYSVEVSTSSGFGTTVYSASGISSTSASATGLSTGTTYYWRVNSTDGSTTSAWSVTAEFITSTSSSGGVTVPIPTYPIGGVTVYTISPTVYWYMTGASVGVTYEVKYSLYPSMISPTTFTGITTTSKALGTLANGTTYYWSVRSYDGVSVYSAWSSPESFVTLPTSSNPVVVPQTGSPVDGVQVADTSPVLSWFLPTAAPGTMYDVQYSKSDEFLDADEISNLEETSIAVDNLEASEVYYWRVRSRAQDGSVSTYSQTANFVAPSVTGVEKLDMIPEKFDVAQNYPNPFNPSTIIRYSIPEAAFVTIKVYNMLGQEVVTLLNKEMKSGVYNVTWQGNDNYGNKVSSGTYLYRVIAGKNILSKKMVLLK